MVGDVAVASVGTPGIEPGRHKHLPVAYVVTSSYLYSDMHRRGNGALTVFVFSLAIPSEPESATGEFHPGSRSFSGGFPNDNSSEIAY